ncbi:Wzz/FepE/Etk N-terminal domain-containing protein [Mucilaginibacter glaciei]|uniref:Lipopolysaccharide biosynthesis protein n=1 Tax=Mucilaginibacter glaciei TaxID=2772109 RepID=A0A926NR30_9SPHI|nr:Wzz/FepE/Etk N-terminal domain-containing protein [Mucilaginibacter glaciei]MBD1392325.1 lipopolysaccharide biosynthesis protein [Mucilaginibacter glaciei]
MQVVSNTDEVSLKDIILKIIRFVKYLLTCWKLILLAAVLGCCLGLGYSFLKKTVYKAELSFALEDDKASGNLGSAIGLASQFGIDLNGGVGGAFSGDNLIELIKSRSMVERTLLSKVNVNGNTQTLANLYIDFNNYRKKWSNEANLSNITFSPDGDRSKFTLQQDSVLGVFYRDITKYNLTVTKVDKKLSIITVDVNSKNEFFSKYFTEILVATVSDFFVKTKTKKSVQNVAILQRQTDSVRKELNAAINGVASSVDVNPNANPSLQILRAPSQRRQVDVQANQAILTQLVANLEVSKVSLRKETPLIQIIDTPILPLEEVKTGKLKGAIIGGFLGVFILVVILISKKFYRATMS